MVVTNDAQNQAGQTNLQSNHNPGDKNNSIRADYKAVHQSTVHFQSYVQPISDYQLWCILSWRT